ncbi:MAG: DUF4037 domain-containing protein, partial [Proteobacteria bacterium]|nr:DUF4037 domain-containing protein [Pseudomonadota bacterium]
SISLVFLLNKQYVPFYKWSHRALKTIPMTGDMLHGKMEKLVRENDYAIKIDIMEQICAFIIDQLNQAGLSNSSSSFLLDHGPRVKERIKDRPLKAIDVWLE